MKEKIYNAIELTYAAKPEGGLLGLLCGEILFGMTDFFIA